MVLAWTLSWAAAGAQAQPKPAPKTQIFRCESGHSVTFSDAPQRCVGGQVSSNRPAAASSPPVVVGRLSFVGAPCPLWVKDPEGPAWTSLQLCYSRYLDNQPSHVAAEAQLAGAAMGECDVDTEKLVNSSAHRAELGAGPDNRRQAIRLWAQWLVRSMDKAVDSVPVDVVRTGQAVTVARLNGPLEMQLPDGQVSEAFDGTVVQPGSQLHVRQGVSFLLGGVMVTAQSKQDRCVRVD